MKPLAILLVCCGLVLPTQAFETAKAKVKVQVVKEVTVVKNVVTAVPFAVPVAVPVATVATPQIFYGVSGCPQPCPQTTEPNNPQPIPNPVSNVHGSQPEVNAPAIVKHCGACHIDKSDGGLNFAKDVTLKQIDNSIKFTRKGLMPKGADGKPVKLAQTEIDAVVDDLIQLLLAGAEQ